MTLERYLEDLRSENGPLRPSALVQFSGLTSEEVEEFRSGWPALSPTRKHDVLARLIELCEDNVEFDFSTVFRVCLADEDQVVREKAARGLWECDDRVIIRPFVALLKSDPSAGVRAAVTMSLGKFADMAQEGKLASRDAERVRIALLTVIDDDNEAIDVKRRAIEAVAGFNSDEVSEIIHDAYESSHPGFRQSAIYAMGRTSNGEWLPIVLDEMQDDDPAIRYEATTACGKLGDQSTVPHLISLLKDDDAQVQISAIQALSAIGGPLAKQAVLQCLKMGDEVLEDAARAALEEIEFDEHPVGLQFDK